MGAAKRNKNVEWEKNRRDRLNLSFSELGKLLPDNDSAMTKLDILLKSIAYIKELQDKNSKLVGNCSNTIMSEMDCLKQKVNELKVRNRQLIELLRNAEKSHPLSTVPFTPPRKWAGKLNKVPKDKLSQVQPLKKGDEPNKTPALNATGNKIPAKIKNKPKKQTKSKPLGKHLVQNKQKNPKALNTPLREINNGVAKSSNLAVKVNVPTSQNSCSEVGNSTSGRTQSTVSQPRTNIVTVAKSNVLTAPIMATGIQPVLQRNPALSALGPGTLILHDGRVVPVPATPTVLATATQIIVNRPATQPAVILMQNLAPVRAVPKDQLRPIVPKPRGKDTTKTTFVNKVPIPAIRTHTFSGRATSNKTVNGKDGKKSNERKKVVRKEAINKKTVSCATDKGLDKCAGQLQKDSTTTETDKSEQNCHVKEVHCLGNTSEKADDSCKTLDKATDNQDDLNSTKRKMVGEDEDNERVKRLKVSECPNVDKSNATAAPIIPDSSCNNNSKTPETPQNGEKESNEKLENSEHFSISAICTKESASKTVSEGITGTENPSCTVTKNQPEKSNTVTSTPVNNVPHQENVGPIHNEKTAMTDKDKEKTNKNNSDQVIEISSEAELTSCIEAEKQIPLITQQNSNVQQQTTDKNDQKKNENNNRPVANVNNNKPNEIAPIDMNCGVSNKLTENVGTQSFPQSTLNPEAKKKSLDSADRNIHENKMIIQDDSQELSSLFPSDPKLQSCPDNIFKDADFRERNLFVPISHSYMDEVRLSLPHSDFSNDLFSSLQVPTGGQHPESISPTAAFLLAFPLVSTSKTSELIAETEAGESQHATPTTILQIGNIEPPSTDPYHQTLMIQGSQDPAKMSKSDESVKSNSLTKQQKNLNHFDKFQHIEMVDLLRSDSFTRNNCGKEKKQFTELPEQDLYMPCNKKKANGRNCDYSVSSDVIPNFHDKAFEYSSNVRHDGIQHNSVGQVRHNGSSINQKKISVHSENLMESNNSYNPSSQSYSYSGSGFSNGNGNDFSVPNSNYSTSNRPINDSSKSLQVSSNFNVIPWSTSSVTTTTTIHNDYTTPYCSNPQKSFPNQQNKIMNQKVDQSSYHEQVMKDKSNSALPKFSANFQFNNNSNISNSNNHSSQETHGYTHINHTENMNYKLDLKSKKTKSNSQRPPVNWMTTPVVRPVLPDSNITSALPDVYQPQKEIDFNPTANNILLSSANNNIAPFSIASSVSNNPQTFYSNSHFTGMDFQLDFAPFPEINSSNKTSRTMSSSQQNPHHYSWSPSKSSVPLLPHLETNMIPSTLPTLVGDLALGTSTPSGPVDTFRSLSMPTTPFSVDGVAKKNDMKHHAQKQVNSKSQEKDNFNNSERRSNNRNVPDYCQKSHSHQSTNTTSSFLSVSQLVDQVKSEQGPSRRGGKQTVTHKNNASIQKRNHNHPTDKMNQSKISNSVNNSNSFLTPNTVQPGSINQRKHDVNSGYQDNQNVGVGFTSGFGTHLGASVPPWQQNKSQRTSANYKGSYSAESLIGDQSAVPTHDHIAELPPFSVSNQFSSQYNHAPIVSGTGYSGHDISHQNIQPLEFHQNSQNCFNFPSQNSHYSAPFNPENDFHLGLDPLYSFNPNSRNSSCQTSGQSKENRSSHKRMQGSKRRDEFQSTQFMQTPQSDSRAKNSLTSTSSPNHPGTTTSLTNFNLSTIFPEINDKRAVAGPNVFHANKHSDGSGNRFTNRADYPITNFNPNMTQMQQVGLTTSVPPHFPPVTFASLCPPAPSNNFRPQ